MCYRLYSSLAVLQHESLSVLCCQLKIRRIGAPFSSCFPFQGRHGRDLRHPSVSPPPVALRRHTRSLQGRRRAGAQLHTCRHRRRREVVARRRIRGQAARPAWSGEGEARGGTRPSTSRRRSPRRPPTPPCLSPSPPLAGLLVSTEP